MTIVHVPGRKSAHVMVYALSTCGWCAKTRKLLEEMGVAYDYEYVDHLVGADRDKAIKEVIAWNPSSSFPTIVINNEKCIVGFREDEIRKAVSK